MTPRQPRVWLLVCEGPCSPATRPYDIAARGKRDPQTLRLGLRLQHTEHIEVDKASFRYRCTRCGTERRYGGGDATYLPYGLGARTPKASVHEEVEAEFEAQPKGLGPGELKREGLRIVKPSNGHGGVH